MNYTIKYARKGTLSIWLEKYGNKYVVSDYDSVAEHSTFKEEFDRFDPAERRFYAICEALSFSDIHDVEHDPAEFCFD